MKTDKLLKLPAMIVALFLFSMAFPQSGRDGNTLHTLIGKPAESPEVQKLATDYHCKTGDPAFYASDNDGIEMVMKDKVLNEIRLHKNSSMYGQFKSDLPKGLKFGMSPAEVKVLMGKPTISYIKSGYCEFVIQGILFACSFNDDGKLSDVTLSKNP